jgi:hypothetical protein
LGMGMAKPLIRPRSGVSFPVMPSLDAYPWPRFDTTI